MGADGCTSRTKGLFEDYDGFVEKFRPKRTTDDCMTPPEVYDCVLGWACERWGIDPAKVVRPFWPGGDYEAFDYPEGAVVLDNPPFSILVGIQAFYLDRGIDFLLFAPSLTCLSGRRVATRVNHVVCDANVTYENGAVVRTGFVTTFGRPTVAMSAPDLHERLRAVTDRLARESRKKLPRYEYPGHVLTAAMLQRYSKYGVDFSVDAEDCALISALDSQRAAGKAIFGGGLLLSERAAAERAAAERAAAERAAAERAAAERAAAHVWELSDREREMVRMLGGAS